MQADAIRVGLFRAPVVRDGERQPALSFADLPVVDDTSRLEHVYDVFAAFADGYVGRANDSAGRWIAADMRFSADPAGFMPLWGLDIAPDSPEMVRWGENIRPSSVRMEQLLAELFGPDVRYRPAAGALD